MKNYLIKKLVWFSQQKRTPLYRVVSCLIGGLFIAAFLPFIFVKFGKLVETVVAICWYPLVKMLIVSVSIPLGLFFIFWAIIFQAKIGRGSPAHCAPTQKLVVSGPYKLCRNPMQFGGILYFLGVGTLFASPTTGIICAVLIYVLGTVYHRTFEEKELAERFGDEYKQYKKTTPFIFPKFWSRKTL